MEQPTSSRWPQPRSEPAPPVPVFTDPTGQRRRLMVLFAAGASVLLAGVLILVGVGIFGGSQSPLSVFGPPGQSHSPGKHSGTHGSQAPGSAGPTASDRPTPSPDPSSLSPSPGSSSPAPSPSSSASASPSKTPPANGHTKSPPPHPSPSSTHAR